MPPALIAALGERTSYRFFEFFTANIRNPNTRRVYAHAAINSSSTSHDEAWSPSFGFWDIVRFKRFPHGAKIADELTQSFTQGLP